MGGPSERSGREAEGDCPAHLGPGSLLNSQANPLPSKPPPGNVGPWEHKTEAKGRTGEVGGRGPPGGVGEEWRVIASLTLGQEACWAPR